MRRNKRRLVGPVKTRGRTRNRKASTVNGKPLIRDGLPLTAGDLEPGTLVTFDLATGTVLDIELDKDSR